MTKLYLTAGLGLAIFLTGCASNHSSARADAASTLSMARLPGDDGRVSANQGQVASILGDTHTSTLLFERAAAADPSPLNKFNLAGAYQNEGRRNDALRLYDQVASEGQDATATTLSPADDRSQRNVRFNLANAARDRAAMLRQVSLAPTAATGDAINTSTGPEASAKLDLTPAQAAALDIRENPPRSSDIPR